MSASTKTTVTTTKKKPLLDQILGKDTIVEERKVVTVTKNPDGTTKTSTAVERVKLEKKDKKKEHKDKDHKVNKRFCGFVFC
jgi:hypothetical protein